MAFRSFMACGMALLLLAATSPARAEITQEELDRFLEETQRRLAGMGEEFDLLSVLHVAGRVGKTPSGMVDAYAKARQIPEDQAHREAEFLIALWRHTHTCSDRPGGRPCAFTKYPELVEQIRRAGREDKTGFVFLTVAQKFRVRYSPKAETDRVEFLKMIKGHPALHVICLGLVRYNGQNEFLIPQLATDHPNVNAVSGWVDRNYRTDTARSNALMVQALERTESRAPMSSDHAFIATMVISKLLVSGQVDEALRIYDAYPDKKQLWDVSIVPVTDWRDLNLARVFEILYARLPGEQPSKYQVGTFSEAEPVADRLAGRVTDTKVGTAAALVLKGRKKEAEMLLDGLTWAELDRLEIGGRQKVYFLREIMKPQLAREHVYNIFIQNFSGSLRFLFPDGIDWVIGRLPPVLSDLLALLAGRTPSWLSLKDAPPFDDLGFDYLSDAGHPAMARYILWDPLQQESDESKYVYDLYADELGEAFFVRAARYRKRIREIEAGREARIRETYKDITPTPVHISERPVVFEERSLPDGVAPFAPPGEGNEDTDDADGRGLPKDLKLPVHPYQIIRLEKTGDEWALIFLSQALDPVGEVSRGGYWIVRSRDEGRHWHSPVYLGLQQFFPYVVTPESNLPLFEGEALQIEVQLRELDTGSITFPPVGLRAKRRKDGLYVRFEWDALTRDRDSDGLTDLVEHRMGLDPENPDTDGDEILDGVDSLPLTAFRSRKPEENELAIAILKNILGYERQAIIVGNVGRRSGESAEDIMASALGPRPVIDPMHTTFMGADPDIFSGIHLPRRLLVYGPDAMELLGKQYGVFYPVSVSWIFSNHSGTKHHVIWSAGWVGGAFQVIRTKDGYQTKILSRWIT